VKIPKEYLVIDFETKDPYISRGFGSGWVFALNHAKEDFLLLGASVYDSRDDTLKYYSNLEELREKIRSCSVWVCHNAQYDIGCVLALFKDNPTFSLTDCTLYDTMLMAKLYKQDLMRYSLEACGEHFGLAARKSGATISDYFWESGLYQSIKEEETGRKVHLRPADNLIFKVAICNLDLVPEEIVAKYCDADVATTNELFKYLAPFIDYDLKIMSEVLKVCLQIRCQGTRVNLDQAREVSDQLRTTEEVILADINNEFDLDLNINSPYQLAEFLETIGIDDYPRTPKGNPSISTKYLEAIDNPWAQAIAEARTAHKIRGTFVDKIIKYQGFNNNINGSRGVMYTTLNPLGAVQTGRFTSGGGMKSFELNIQQIPSARTTIGKLCRSMFLPNKGETWVHADFSNQEPRIQVHYAVQLKCTGAKEVAAEWSATPSMSFHEKVANITGLKKQAAKTINLGLSYGMGEAKMCEGLKLPTVAKTIFNGKIIQVAGAEGLAILEKYHKLLPFMQQVTAATNTYFKQKGCVKTLGGRTLKINPYYPGDYRKGFSKLIQGSAADQTMQALIRTMQAGLTILNTVHDEINISTKHPVRDGAILKECMEEALPVVVPMIAEVKAGPNWAELVGEEDE
jgi:DNA polymerase I-like protein with 3'-5' exonuclease and polymerase domains